MIVKIDYTNWKNERSIRAIQPLQIVFVENQYHKPAQWLMIAFDIEKEAIRYFAMKDIHSWESTNEISNIAAKAFKDHKLQVIKENGWTECCLYDNLYDPPSRIDRASIRDEGDNQQMVWSIDAAFDIQIRIGNKND